MRSWGIQTNTACLRLIVRFHRRCHLICWPLLSPLLSKTLSTLRWRFRGCFLSLEMSVVLCWLNELAMKWRIPWSHMETCVSVVYRARKFDWMRFPLHQKKVQWIGRMNYIPLLTIKATWMSTSSVSRRWGWTWWWISYRQMNSAISVLTGTLIQRLALN